MSILTKQYQHITELPSLVQHDGGWRRRMDGVDGTVEARHPYRANSCAGSANALISTALPLGSRKNIVACSPTCPLKRT